MGDDYGMWTAALQSLNNSLANSANVIMASNTSKEDRKFSREMSDLAWQRNLEAWNMQNEYNNPTNVYARQLEGIRANGLNPNLVYGGSSSVTGSAGSVSPYKFESWHSQAPQFGRTSAIQELYNTRLLQTQVAAQEANVRLINARADSEEARLPGYTAKSNEAAYRWQYIQDNILDNYEESVRADVAKSFWTEQKVEYDAATAHYKRDLAFYEASVSEWLNTTEIPGLGMTYKQYMEACKALIPGEQYIKLKADVLDIMSKIAYREKQGEFLDLKKEFQVYVNKLAKYGRSLGNNWANLILSALETMFPDWAERLKGALGDGANFMGEHRDDVSPTGPGP